MDGIVLQLALIALLIIINASLAGTEIALVTLTDGQIDRLEAASRRGRTLARVARSPNRFLSTIQLGITLAGFLASAVAAISLAEPLLPYLEILQAAARPVAVFAVTLALTFVMLVVGELAPKRLALQRAERWALVAAQPLHMFATLVAPLIWLLSHATNLTVRLFGGDPRRGREAVTPEQIRDLVAAVPEYSEHQQRIIHGALEVAERTLREIVVPRTMVVALASDTPVPDALAALAAAGHSRAPVYATTLDDADRVVSVLALIRQNGVVGTHAHPAVLLPESLNAVAALAELQQQRQQLAIVVSEHGSVEGIVTVEDLVEELVGEIFDEHDRDLQTAQVAADGTIHVPGMFPVHDLVDLGLQPPQTEAVSVSGLMTEHLGRLPREGDAIVVDGACYTVLRVRRHVVDRAAINPPSTPYEPTD